MQEMQVRSLGREDPLEEEMAIHTRILVWETSWTGEPSGLSLWGYKESDITKTKPGGGGLVVKQCLTLAIPWTITC